MGKRVKYITMWGYPPQPCSEHSTEKAARNAIKKCEAKGGAKHALWRVQELAADRTKTRK